MRSTLSLPSPQESDLPEFRPPPHRSTRMIGTHRQKARPKLPCARSSAANGLAQSHEGLWRQASLCSRDITPLPRRMVEGSASFWPRSQAIPVCRKWSFTSPTRRAPVQQARPTTCSRKARTSPATGAPGNGGLALLGSAWQASLLRRTGYSTQAPALRYKLPS
jgi:hypothetical protein